MQNNDTELIQRTLDGDQTAFTELVEKYQKGIHALAWRKIGDFHIAQEITQDAFLRAYQRLRTLKDHSLFPGWVYVIASHLCTEWHRKKKLPIQSLEATDVAEIDQVSHSHYMAEKRDTEAAEARREVVQKLLQKLPESERTVMALHYLGEMTCEAISKMLGVSPNTIKSRLSRARNRLRKEEAIIRENLSSFQLPTQLTQDIMKEVARVNPIVPSSSKPFVPWVVSAASAILVLLLIGIGVQHLSLSFQPYDLDSESVLTVEIVDTPVSVARKIKPDSRNQLGTTDISSKSQGTGEKMDTSQNVNFTNVIPTIETELPLSTERWTQLDIPGAVQVSTLFATKTNDLFAITPIGLYRMTTDNQRWRLINSNLPAMHPTRPIPITEQGGTLYIVADEAVLASEDKGKTWKSLGPRPKGRVIDLIVRDNAQGAIEIYLALLQGVFRSNDAGVSWTPLNNGLKRRKIYALTSVENALFAGTNRGLFRFNLEPNSEDGLDRSGVWEKLPVAESKSIHAFAVAGHRLYVVAGLLKISADMKNFMDIGTTLKVMMSKKSLWSVFRSTDRGNSWTDITPTNVIQNEYAVVINKIVAKEKTVMLLIVPASNTVRSTDEGKTWITVPLVKLTNPNSVAALKVQSSNESSHQQSTDVKSQFYIGDNNGIRRSTDSGNSWKRFNAGLGGNIQNLTVFNNKLYAVADKKLITSTDGGQSWKAIPVESSDMHITFMKKKIPLTKVNINIQQITEADGILYAKGYIGFELIFFYLNEENRALLPIQGVPTFGEKSFTAFMKAMQTSIEDDGKEEEDIKENANNFIKNFLSMGTDIFGGFAVSGNTFYVEHRQKLLIWHSESQVNNDASWYDTKIEDTRDMADFTSLNGFNSFKFGVSGDTVYVGKPDGVLLYSVDRGRNWKTVQLPIAVEAFKQILINDETVYVATHKEALSSSDGAKWNIITDLDGQQLMIDRFVLDDTTLYAVSSSKNAQGGVYRLTSTDSTWEHITPEIPDNATSIAVANGVLYVGTENSGLQLIGLEDSSHTPLTKAEK